MLNSTTKRVDTHQHQASGANNENFGFVDSGAGFGHGRGEMNRVQLYSPKQKV